MINVDGGSSKIERKIIISGPGGINEEYTQAELTEQWSLMHELKQWLNSINPVGRWMATKPPEETQE